MGKINKRYRLGRLAGTLMTLSVALMLAGCPAGDDGGTSPGTTGSGAVGTSTPTLAVMANPQTASGVQFAIELATCADLAIPIAAVYVPGPLPGDCDRDGDVDLDDFGSSGCFADCLQGPQAGLPANCELFDIDGDGDIDLWDFAGLQELLGTP